MNGIVVAVVAISPAGFGGERILLAVRAEKGNHTRHGKLRWRMQTQGGNARPSDDSNQL
jgi:hypothetical protein